MKKNNKGFTLVELLAALVILGVLAFFALPTVVNLLSDSRNKLYITDAKKLISQAEYKFRGASSEIEKPDNGECLVLSMVYLDNSDFDNAPNDGKYLREASYVVVKNNNGNYEFSVELVEEISKTVYKGVELTKDSNLKTSSTRHVVNFSKDDLNFVESNTVMGSYNGKQLDSDYINSKLGTSYVEAISKVYNYPDLADSTYNANYAIPRIARVEYTSASNKNFNSLDAILKIVAVDSDTKTNDLQVIIGPGSAGRYPTLEEAQEGDVNQPYDFTPRRYSYGMLNDFSLEVDFSTIHLGYSGDTTSLYIIVIDPEGNTDRINPTYTIHTNEPPIIDIGKSGVFKKNTDNVNLLTAVIRLVATDDITPAGDLEYCITEDKDATSCSNYRKYSEFNNYEKDYTFTCGGECNYDGRTLSLKVFLRDTDPTRRLETTTVFNYQIFKNNAPEIVEVNFSPENLAFLENSPNSKSLKTGVSIKINDTSNENDITVILDESENFDKNPISLKYSDFTGDVAYTFSGYYDGELRTLHVKVIDEYGAVTTYKKDYGYVYLNQEPEVKNVSFESLDILSNVCPNTRLCDRYGDNGGAYLFNVRVDAVDDLVDDDNLLICISDKSSDCVDKNSQFFRPYSLGASKYMEIQGTKVYDGKPITLYVVLYDDYASDINGNSTLAKYYNTTATYKIYENQPPEINEDEISIVSDNIDYNFRDVKVSFKAFDDLDVVSNLTYNITDGHNTVSDKFTATSGDESNVVPFSFGGDYDGENRELTIEIIDSYGAKSITTRNYQIHRNEAPNISLVTVESVEKPCNKDVCLGGNGLKTNVRINVKDDLDSNIDDLNVCLRVGSGTCTNYVPLKNYTGMQKDSNGDYILPYTITLNDTLPYKGTALQIYVYVKDSAGEVGSRNGSYVLYNNRPANIDASYPIVKSSNDDEFLTLSTIKFKLKATDEFIPSSNLKFNVCYFEIPKNSNGKYEDDSVANFLSTLDDTALRNAPCINNGLYNFESDSDDIATVDVQLPVDPDEGYAGQKYILFAKVYDDYAQACYNDSSACNGSEDYVSISSLAFYDIYNDVPSTINKFTVSRPTGVTSYEKLNVEFNVTDLYDTYQYCISEEGFKEEENVVYTFEELQAEYRTKCTNYSSSYSGDSTGDITLEYSPTWSTLDNDRTYLIYLYIKDSYGNITAASAFPDRIPCSSSVDSEGFVDSGQVQDEVVYELKSGYSELTAQTCNYKCYYWKEYEVDGVIIPGSTETLNIKSYYKKTVTFLDKEDSSVVCGNEVTEDFEVHCNFKTCFKNSSGGYSVPVIGYMVRENTKGFSHVHEGETHIPENIRYEYISEYDNKTDYIKLTHTGNFICDDCYKEGLYNNTVVAYDNNEE